MDNQEQQEIIKKFKIKMRLGLSLIVVVGLFISIYFIFINPIESNKNKSNTKIVNTSANTNIVIDNTADWQTYEDKINGYSIKYPTDYLIKLEADGYVIFDSKSIDSPDTSYLNISVKVEDNDLHTYRLGILTSPATQSNTVEEEDVIINSLSGKMITFQNALGETIIHYIFPYLGKVYDISAGDSVDSVLLIDLLDSFEIIALRDNVDVSDIGVYTNKICVSNNDCGAYPCVEGNCLVKECISDDDCPNGMCGLHATPVPGYCTTIDVL